MTENHHDIADSSPRLDVLLYAHDGRGLGHVSRTIAIGIALRRLFPELRVLFLTGCNMSQEFIDSAPLDWIKLPSYETTIANGKSTGIPGKSNFEDSQLGSLRGEHIKHIVATYRPRIVLADHSPQGKHRELLPALQMSNQTDTQWVLGIRGVVGQVKQVSSTLAASIFQKFYSSLLWYGDSQILGNEQLTEIESQFGCKPYECGYVSALQERIAENDATDKDPLLGTISIPWFGERTSAFLECLYTVLKDSKEKHRRWHVYLDQTYLNSNQFTTLFNRLPGCRVEPPGKRYLDSLLRSHCAIIYGGYNSLMDVLSLSLPALVVLRDMQDNEQQEHLNRLVTSSPQGLSIVNEECSEDQLSEALQKVYMKPQPHPFSINLHGAEAAARYLAGLL